MGDRSGINSIIEVQRTIPVGIPLFALSTYYIGLVALPGFFLSSKKDRIRFEDSSENPYALSFWIIKAGCSESNALFISADNTVTQSFLSAADLQSSVNLIKVVSQLCCFLKAAIL